LFYGVPGIACGIIAIVLHKKDKQLYLSNPAAYEASFKNSKAGQICGIIGLSLSVLFLIFLIIYFFFIFSVIGYGLTHSAGN
jgi:branched-subunit amino acid transport protein AzlD